MDSEFGNCAPKRTLERRSSSEQFFVEDLLDFSNDDGVIQDEFFDNGAHNSNSNDSFESSSNVFNPLASGHTSSSGNNDVAFPMTGEIGSHGFSDTHFSGEICVPYDELAELEWLSNFVEESFSSDDLQKSHLISGMSSAMKAQPDSTGSSETRYYEIDSSKPDHAQNPVFTPEIPGKARSKRSRPAPCNWTSRLKVLSNVSLDPAQSVQIVSKASSKKKCGSGFSSRSSSNSGLGSDISNGEVRKCLHCATDKTPQWRTGPMGPKTLCNACGVRYKSGRLVPEYRPASSPTFVMTKHSNSHRKVMELRRQKDLMKQHQYFHDQQQLIHHSNMMFDPTNTDDYLIHQHSGPDYRQLT